MLSTVVLWQGSPSDGRVRGEGKEHGGDGEKEDLGEDCRSVASEEFRHKRASRHSLLAGKKVMIRQCDNSEFDTIYEIINDAAQAYRGVIPADCWKEPYMSRDELRREMDEGVVFWGCEEDGELVGVACIQQVQDVTLIRHAYVRTPKRNQGIGGSLLSHLRKQTTRPILVGTWGDAVWAIRFYEKHGFRLVSLEEKDRLLRKYWSIPERQIETSVVLADRKWFDARRRQATGA